MIRPWLLVVMFVLASCQQKAGSPSYAYETMDYSAGGYAGDEDSFDDAESTSARAPVAFGRDMAVEEKRSRKADSAPAAPPPPPSPAQDPAPEPEPAPQAAPQRMVHYDGWAQMRATDPTEVVDQIAALAIDAKGRVDRLAGNHVSVRVPVERFDEIWQAVLALGDVLNKGVRADDVTAQFLAVELRTRTLKATRDRLVILLAKAESEEEKLALLQHITRVTEELDATESQLRTLADLAALSRISVDVVPREAFGTSNRGPELAGFQWIRALSPFNRGIWNDNKRVGLPVPSGLVSLSNTGPFMAESADATVLWTLRVPNDPIGTGDFWVAAIEDRISLEFAAPTRRTVGAWECLTLDEPGADEPYHWMVCLTPVGRHLHVAQAYFPSPEQHTRYKTVVDGALTAGGGS